MRNLLCLIGIHRWKFNTDIRLQYPSPGDSPIKSRLPRIQSASLTRKCDCCGKEQKLPGTYTH